MRNIWFIKQTLKIARYIATSANPYSNQNPNSSPTQCPKPYPSLNTNLYPNVKFCRNIGSAVAI